jgi:hypothetical protein
MTKDYNPEIQRLFLEMMLEDAETYVRVQNIYNAENFDRSLREAARFIKKHSDDHRTLPTREQIKATCGVELREVPELKEGHYEWFLAEFESFSRKQELERAILQAADMIEKGDFDPVEKLIKDAVQISLTKDMGTDYFADPAARINKYFNSGGQVSTGWPSLDKLLYGGFSRGELNIFAGGSGSGKSLVMMNIALNWLQAGLNGVYITLELSEELTSLRTDAMLSNMSTKDIRKDIDTTTIQTGRTVDFIMIDYLDLLMPVSAKVSPNDLFVKDKYVSEELRNLAKELGMLMVTASQLNRSAVEEVEFDHSHISGGISKINTADNVFGIFTSRAMRERGRYQIQCMKSRSSTGVGMKVDLEYNIETMRITDPGPDAQSENGGQGFRTSNQIMDQIKTSATTSPPMIAAKPKPGFDLEKSVQANVDSSKLRSMLASLKTKTE